MVAPTEGRGLFVLKSIGAYRTSRWSGGGQGAQRRLHRTGHRLLHCGWLKQSLTCGEHDAHQRWLGAVHAASDAGKLVSALVSFGSRACLSRIGLALSVGDWLADGDGSSSTRARAMSVSAGCKECAACGEQLSC